MIKKIVGIVVNEVDYKESSKIVNILTEDGELIGAIAKGAKKIKSKVFFLNADNATLLKRYSETRRKHPLGMIVKEGIVTERKMMEVVRKVADVEIDTTQCVVPQFTDGVIGLIFRQAVGRVILEKTVARHQRQSSYQ